MHSATVALSPGQIPWLQLLYSKSVRDLVQWSLCFLRDPRALSSTLASLGMLQPGPSGLLKCIETLDSVSNYYKDCQTEAGSEDCSQSKMGSNIEFIIAQTVVQCNNKGDYV